MDESRFIDNEEFAALFRAGRFKPKPNFQVIEISGCCDGPIEAVIADSEDHILGCCWQADLERLIQIADLEKDTILSNPNIHVVSKAIGEIKNTRERLGVLAQRVAYQHAATVVQFRSH